MKVLGIAGSPRINGNTDMLLAEVMRGATENGAEVTTIYLRELNISPCLHCDNCLKDGECNIADDMKHIYLDLEFTDKLVLASPLHFMGLTSQTKLMVDRCQSLWVRKYKLKIPPLRCNRMRKGLFISVGGRRMVGLFEPALATVKALFSSLDIEYSGSLVFPGIDEKEAIKEHPDALQRAFLAGQRLTED
ncbi:MAG: flavodoxin family protein [Dehalococcoidia bacterium]|nr:MAG: flavodoxin family protein [Dehalococcoidia bacterium]